MYIQYNRAARTPAGPSGAGRRAQQRQRPLMPSPAQPQQLLTDAELVSCLHTVNMSRLHWSATHPSGGPIILTYATGVPEHWLLAASAALHGSPLVLVGLGRRGWHWYSGGGGKLPGVARALQLIKLLAPPKVPVVFADASDTIVANKWTSAQAASMLTSRTSGYGSVLTGGECNSWPLCYNTSYLNDHAFGLCRQKGHATCFPNSGTYLGLASDLSAFVDGLRDTVSRLNARGYQGRLAAEKGDDQAALHRFYLSRTQTPPSKWVGMRRADHPTSASQPSRTTELARSITLLSSTSMTVQVDGANSFFLSLFSCSGKRFRLRGNGPYEYCHEKDFDAMPGLTATLDGASLVYSPRASIGEATATALRPFLLHANGKHYRLHVSASPMGL